MSDQTVTQEPSTEPTPSTEPSLEDVYKQYNVTDVPQDTPAPRQTQQDQPQPTAPQNFDGNIPDAALDPEGHRAWARGVMTNQAKIAAALKSVAGEIGQYKAAQLRAKEEADLSNAVSVIKEKLPDVDPDIAEIAIAHKARKDAKFMSLWQNRGQNPQAWNAALKAVAGEIGNKLSMRQDPQVTENLRAAKQSVQTHGSAAPEERDIDRIGKLSGSEFDREMQRRFGRKA